jgi:DNA-binding NarL/FixJ family response regulator
MSKPYSKIRVLIADDHEMVRDGLRVMIRKMEELEIIGDAANGEELVQLTRELKPDVVLTDIRMPKMDGKQATRLIKEEFPHIGIIALSSYDDETLILDMLQAGAKGYLLKNAGKAEVTAAVQAVYRDEAYYCQNTNAKLAQLVASGGFTAKRKAEEPFTPREREVIRQICLGKTSKEIAAALDIKSRTIERYRDSIMKKMNVNNAAGVVLYAVKHGLAETTSANMK